MVRLYILAVFGILLPSAYSQSFQRSCVANNCQCDNKYVSFCGTDDVTYNNKCLLECNQKQCNPGLRVKFEGVCAVKYVHDEGSKPGNTRDNLPQSSFNSFVTARPGFRRVQAAVQVRPQFNQQRQTPESPFPSFGRSTPRSSVYNQYDEATTNRGSSANYYTTTRRPLYDNGSNNNNLFGGNRESNQFGGNQNRDRTVVSYEYVGGNRGPNQFDSQTRRTDRFGENRGQLSNYRGVREDSWDVEDFSDY